MPMYCSTVKMGQEAQPQQLRSEDLHPRGCHLQSMLLNTLSFRFNARSPWAASMGPALQ